MLILFKIYTLFCEEDEIEPLLQTNNALTDDARHTLFKLEEKKHFRQEMAKFSWCFLFTTIGIVAVVWTVLLLCVDIINRETSV